MKKKNSLPYFFIFGVLVFLMTRSKFSGEKIRGWAAATLSPIWETMTPAKQEDTDLLALKLENQFLKGEIVHMQELLKEAFYLNKKRPQSFEKTYQALLKKRLEAIPARVIYRAPSSWNQSLWINVGHSMNKDLEKPTIAINSPVVLGNSLVGVIDYVGKDQSRLRLITDPQLCPAVRAVRGGSQNLRLIETIDVILDHLADQNAKEAEALMTQLERLQELLSKEKETLYLAKGELQGRYQPNYRSHGQLLKGTGFNCDFDDERGPARDLRTGIPYERKGPQEPLSLLKVHDLLITSGLDGIFPEGLNVAEVIHVDPLEEGSFYYNLQARPTVGNLDHLSLVYVLPPETSDSIF